MLRPECVIPGCLTVITLAAPYKAIMPAEPSTETGALSSASQAGDPARSADARLGEVSGLLETIDVRGPQPSDAGGPRPDVLLGPAEQSLENKLVQVRLGIGSGLFAALRAKHAPTAHHSLRVALGCSAWATMLGMSDADRDELELAALLHDIGKISVPDVILMKPSPLTSDEYHIVERHRQVGADILRTCLSSDTVIDIVQHAGAWYDGSRELHDLAGDQLPLGSRVVAIFDAYDAMTSDQVYRRALSRERALAELFECAGTQFDPRLVQEFCGYVNADHVKLQ